MANDNIKWSSEEMIKNAENWSLAGDVALLNSLKDFSQRLLSETVSISNNVDNLLNNLEEVSLKLDLTRNDFHSLRNTQFIENRVYEDDETVQNETKKVEEKELTEEEKEKTMCEAIEKGLNVMRKYYDKVELDVSDSEEENEKSYVLKQKDPYADRPLPYLVGTEEWHKHWHVGLLPSESESESEKEQDNYSSSESEEYLPKDRPFGGSETSSELDFVNQHTGPVANSTFNDTQNHRTDAFHSSDESSESLSAKTPISNKNFAEQLADKLGDVIKSQDQSFRSVNVNPLQKPSQEPKHGNLFSDDPPPLDESVDNTILPKSAKKGLFSPSEDIFSSNTEESLWQEPQVTKEPVPVASKSSTSGAQKSYGGLFDDSESGSEEDMFEVAQKRKVAISKPYLQQRPATLPFIDDQPPEITPQKKPVTEKPKKTISLFDNSSEEEEINFNIKVNNKKEDPGDKKQSKTLSLFDDEDDIASSPSEGSFGKKHNQSLFDDEEDISAVQGTQVPQEIPSELKKEPQKVVKKISLFDDDDDDDFLKEEEDIFSTKTMSLSKPTISSSKGLFIDEDQVEKVEKFEKLNEDVIKPSLFADLHKSENKIEEVKKVKSPDDKIKKKEDVDNTKPSETANSKDKLDFKPNKQETIAQVNKKVGLFVSDSESSSEDELFGVKKELRTKELEDEDKASTVGLLPNEVLEVETSNVVKEKVKKEEPKIEQVSGEAKSEELFAPPPLHLFDPTPPPPDLDWQDDKSDASAESDTFSLGDEIIERSNLHQSQLSSSLFDDAPPSLDVNNSSGIVKDINVTRVETDDSSFYPYASSSRRLSSDVYGEQQSQDSFFLTRNRTESSQQVSNLDDIPEVASDSSSKIDNLTPSGDVNDFEEDSLFSSKSESANSIMTKFEEEESSAKNPETTKEMEKSVGESKTEEDDKVMNKEAPPKKASPGKLKHNLNINVGALLPGAAPIKIRISPARSVSLDEADHQVAPQPLFGAPTGPPPPRVSRPKSAIISEKEILETVGGFEEVGQTEVLHSVTKDRARIPVKRRPSSRRARQEAVRKSMTDFNVRENDDSGSLSEPAAEKGISLVFDQKNTDILVEKMPLNSQKQDNLEDFLQQNARLGAQPKLSNKSAGLFSDNSSESEDDLFAVKPTKKPEEQIMANRAEKPNLFEKENSDGELFGGGIKKGSAPVGATKKASLFDDDEESEDDLFGSKTTEKKATSSASSIRPPIKTANIKKLENKKVTDFDPLSALK